MSLEPEEFAFRAKALAQGHPLTPLAKQLADRAMAEQKSTQHLAEVGTWASTSLITGYCVRRVEEDIAGLELKPADCVELDADQLDEAATRIATELRTGEKSYALGGAEGEERTIAALDKVIGSEVVKRIQNWKEHLDHAARAEVEDYITFWVVKGYAVRAAEMAAGALA